MPRKTPPKSPKPTDNIWRWKTCYWWPGDQIQARGSAHTVTEVCVNKFGRVSYRAGSATFLLEELIPATHVCTP